MTLRCFGNLEALEGESCGHRRALTPMSCSDARQIVASILFCCFHVADTEGKPRLGTCVKLLCLNERSAHQLRTGDTETSRDRHSQQTVVVMRWYSRERSDDWSGLVYTYPFYIALLDFTMPFSEVEEASSTYCIPKSGCWESLES